MVPKKTATGTKADKYIKFDPALIGTEMTDSEKTNAEMKMLEESGYPDNENALIKINPELFASFKFLSKADPEEMFAKNAEYWQPVLSQLSAILANNPYVDQEALTHELLYSFFQSRADDFINKNPQPQTGGAPQGGDTSGMGGGMSGLSNAMYGLMDRKRLSTLVGNRGAT